MSFAYLIIKTQIIKWRKHRLHQEKKQILSKRRKTSFKYTRIDKFENFFVTIRHKLSKCCKRLLNLRKGSKNYKFCKKLCSPGTFDNYILRSFCGFLSGVFLTYIIYMFLVLTLNFKILTATVICIFLGSFLTLGLAFSKTIRCLVFLIVPQLLTARGRQALLAYAFILTLTGPGKNTINNMRIMVDSLACGQEQLKEAIRNIVSSVKKPYQVIRDTVKKVINTVKNVVDKIKQVFQIISKITTAITDVIKSAFMFLAKIFNVCDKKVGSPFARCAKVFDDAVLDCQAQLGPYFSWVCNITYVIKAVCYLVKPIDWICALVNWINEGVIGDIFRKARNFVRHVRSLFSVRIKFTHSYDFESNQSISLQDVVRNMTKEIQERRDRVMKIFDSMSCTTSLFFGYLILQAWTYRRMYLTSDRFDNRFINKEFREIDIKRAQMGQSTLLPLKTLEKMVYIQPRSIRLTWTEWIRIFHGILQLSTSILRLVAYLTVDYSLYWLLHLIREHGRITANEKISISDGLVSLKVNGDGFLADLYKSVTNLLSPIGFEIKLDTAPCLPDPIAPDKDRYIEIGALVLASLVLTILEPYGLRVKHCIMRSYYPYRSRERAVWLYNKISRNRDNFLVRIRRRLRRKALGLIPSEGEVSKGVFKRMKTKISGPKADVLSGKSCLLCGIKYKPEKKDQFYKCPTPKCPGLYCQLCFTELRETCTVCKQPMEYDDISDVDEEVDSSDDQNLPNQKLTKPKSKKPKVDKMKNVMVEKTQSITKKLSRYFLKKKKSKSEGETEDEERLLTSKSLSDQTEPVVEQNNSPRQRAGLDKQSLTSKSESLSSFKTKSSSSTYLSYSYQYQKDYKSSTALPIKISSKDVEKQNYPDYVTMQIFEENFFEMEKTLNIDPSEPSTDTDNETKSKSSQKLAKVPESFSESDFTTVESDIILQKFLDSLNNETFFPSIKNYNSDSDEDTSELSESKKSDHAEEQVNNVESNGTSSGKSAKILKEACAENETSSSLMDMLKILYPENQSSNISLLQGKSRTMLSFSSDSSRKFSSGGNSTPTTNFPAISSLKSEECNSTRSPGQISLNSTDISAIELMELLNLEGMENISDRKSSGKIAESSFSHKDETKLCKHDSSSKVQKSTSPNDSSESFLSFEGSRSKKSSVSAMPPENNSTIEILNHLFLNDVAKTKTPRSRTSVEYISEKTSNTTISSVTKSNLNLLEELFLEPVPKTKSENSEENQNESLSDRSNVQKASFSSALDSESKNTTSTSSQKGSNDFPVPKRPEAGSSSSSSGKFPPEKKISIKSFGKESHQSSCSESRKSKLEIPRSSTASTSLEYKSTNFVTPKLSDVEVNEAQKKQPEFVLVDSSSSTTDTIENVRRHLNLLPPYYSNTETSDTEDTALRFENILPKPN